MRNKAMLGLTLLIMLSFITSCSDTNKEQTSEFKGIVTKRQYHRVLVVSLSPVKYNEKDIYDAVWFTLNDSDFKKTKLGQQIKVIYEGVILASSPGRGTAKRIEYVEEDEPNQTKISQNKAILMALEKNQDMIIPNVRSIIFNKETNIWMLEIVDEQKGSKKSIAIEDSLTK